MFFIQQGRIDSLTVNTFFLFFLQNNSISNALILNKASRF